MIAQTTKTNGRRNIAGYKQRFQLHSTQRHSNPANRERRTTRNGRLTAAQKKP
jgi:hypothetical protein